MACRAPAVFREYHPLVARRRIFWGLLAAAAAAVLLIAGVVVRAITRAESELKRHEHEIVEWEARLPGRDFRRPVVIGEPVEGNAWDFYDRFSKLQRWMQGNSDWDQVWKILGYRMSQYIDDDAEAQERVLRWARETLADLREGVRRTRVDPGFESVGPTYVRRLNQAQAALQISAVLIIAEHRAGKDADAMETAALLFAAAQDQARGGAMEGFQERAVTESTVLRTCRSLFQSLNASAADLHRFSSRLDALDGARETARDAWMHEDLHERKILLESARFEIPGEPPAQAGWRCLFSDRIMRAQALSVCEAGFRRMREASSLEPYERYQGSLRLEAELQDHPNPLVRLLNFDSRASRVWTVPWVQREDALALTHRALLRLAIAIARYELDAGKPPETLEALVPKYLPKIPRCEFSGQPFRYAPGRVWSVGANGVDDGGLDPEDDSAGDGGDKDIVWRIARKAK